MISNSVNPLRFWSIYFAICLVATLVFSACSFASGKPKRIVIKKPVVKIGTPYRAELRRKDRTEITPVKQSQNKLSPEFWRNEDRNLQYLEWRNSVHFGNPIKH